MTSERLRVAIVALIIVAFFEVSTIQLSRAQYDFSFLGLPIITVYSPQNNEVLVTNVSVNFGIEKPQTMWITK